MSKKRLRIIITVKPGTSRELYEDLEALPVADRSERVRMLATLGALATRGGLVPTGASLQAERQPGAAEARETVRNGVAPSVLSGFDDEGWDPDEG